MRGSLILLLFISLLPGGSGTPLDDYVNKPDPTYRYEVLSKYKGPDFTLYTINMTSQTWMPDWQSQPVWWHYLSMVIPDIIEHTDAGFLFIDGGSNNKEPPPPSDTMVAMVTLIAVSTKSIGANLKMVPNQPIVFKDDPEQKRRTEDAIIAWTWKTFIQQNGSNPEVLLRMPMTKAAVRALDTMDDMARKTVAHKINRFFAAGASKRGWTTWTTGAVDRRMIAIAPIVMDLLNMQENLHHYYRALGGWTFAFKDYYELNFTAELDNPVMKKMASIIDPLSYTDRYANMSKMICSAGGDEFFMVDDSRFYKDRLKGPTYFRQIPNAEHSLAGHETSLVFAIRAFYLANIRGQPLPKMSWTKEFTKTGGKITLTTDTPPTTVHAFHATTLGGERKDFRLVRGTPGDPTKPLPQPVIWLSQYVTPLGNNTFSVELTNPNVGWTAFFIQVTFAQSDATVFEFTTETLIIPDTYPFPDCHGDACRGNLV